MNKDRAGDLPLGVGLVDWGFKKDRAGVVLCLDEIQVVSFGWMRNRWGDGVMGVADMGTVLCG